jgi:hypothetical protein
MSEQHVAGQFDNIATVTHVKLIRDKVKGTPVGYGFVEFSDAQTAKEIFETLNGQPIPGSNKVFKLNWASHGGGVARVGPSAGGPGAGAGAGAGGAGPGPGAPSGGGGGHGGHGGHQNAGPT